MTDDWYEEVGPDEPLLQGDLVPRCTLHSWSSEPITIEGTGDTERVKGKVDRLLADIVILSQSCDLEQRKFPLVIVCPSRPLDEHRSSWVQHQESATKPTNNKAWKSHCKAIRDGFVWNLTMLNHRTKGSLTTPHRIVAFHDVNSIPIQYLESLTAHRGEARLRLRSPYVEHLSQAFARFFMRVGLPAAIEDAW